MTDLNLDLKKRFDLCYEMNTRVALCVVALYVESLELRALTPEQKVLILSKELQRLKLEADAFSRKDYLIFAGNQDCLYNVFFSHFLIYQSDEEPLLLQGLVVFEKLKCTTRLLAGAKRQLPAFDYADFWVGKENIPFYELDERPRGTCQKDYDIMMNCCIQQKDWR